MILNREELNKVKEFTKYQGSTVCVIGRIEVKVGHSLNERARMMGSQVAMSWNTDEHGSLSCYTVVRHGYQNLKKKTQMKTDEKMLM